MAAKCKCEEGAPLWVMTFGDMMSLLLTFFILLVSLSEIKKEDEYRVIVEIVQKAFGMRGGGGKVRADNDPTLTLRERLDKLELKSNLRKQISNSDDPGIEGKEMLVTKVRDGWFFVTGGRVTFGHQSAELTEEGKVQLAQLGNLIKGERLKVVIQGHASNLEASGLEDYRDLRDLAFNRARAAEDFLASEAGGGIDTARIRLQSSADREPLVKREYSLDQHMNNRRVEIYVIEATVDELTEPEKRK